MKIIPRDTYLGKMIRVIDTPDIINAEGQRGAAQYDGKNKVIKVNRPFLKQKFREKTWTKMRELTETIHGEVVNSKAKDLPENQFETYEQFEAFVIEHEYQHSVYPREIFDKENPGKTKGDYETAINERALSALGVQGILNNKTGMDELFSPMSPTQYQLPQGREMEEFVASEKTIRDLAARISDRIGIPVRFESDRTKDYKGKLENGTAVINLAYATLDTPIHEILGHPIIRAIRDRKHFDGSIDKYNDAMVDFYDKNPNATREEAIAYADKKVGNNQTDLYQNLLKELEYGKGKEVLDRIKRDYVYKDNNYYVEKDWMGNWLVLNKNNSEKNYGGLFNSEQAALDYINSNFPTEKYTLEEQQEEALVELLGLYTAGRLNKVKDGKLISLLKRLLKEMKAFMKQLLGQKEVEIDKLPDNMTLGDIADLLAYSNSKLILPGNEVVYTTPDNQQFKTYQEASNHISELAKSVEDVDLSDITVSKDIPDNFTYIDGNGDKHTFNKINENE